MFCIIKGDFRLCSCVGPVLFSFADVSERATLRGCQCSVPLGRIKPLRILTPPCQKRNPDGGISA